MTDADWGGYPAAYSQESQSYQGYRSTGASPYVHPAHAGEARQAAGYGYEGAGAQAYGMPPPYGYDAQPAARIGAGQPGEPSKFTKIINGTGAMLSVALIAGLAVWGYKLAVRDVTGVPVVRALEGPMRVQPDDPGGVAADYQGLAVNDVAAGAPDQLAEEVALAPAPMSLSDEDQPAVAVIADAGSAEVDGGTTDLSEADILAMVDSATANIQPLSASISEDAVLSSTVPVAEARTVVPASVPGVTVSPRPVPRPADLVTRAATSPVDLAVASATAATEPAYHDVAISDVPSGTRLVQLGAFDSVDVAQAEWTKIMNRFSDVFVGKDRVVEKAQSGGKTFYRLRAMNFADLSDARRFCSALMAEKAACIPVVAR